jgi:hypothetical protein
MYSVSGGVADGQVLPIGAEIHGQCISISASRDQHRNHICTTPTTTTLTLANPTRKISLRFQRQWSRPKYTSDVSNSEMTLKSMFTSKTRLSDALRLGMKKSAFEKTPYTFLPQSALDSIIIEDTILMALGITKPTPEDCKLVAYILTKAKRLFATAAYVGLPSDTLYCAMVLFRNANFSDERLPLEEMGGEDFLKNKMNGLKHPLVKLEGHLKPNAERIWTFSRIHDFLKAQFSFLTPIFSAGKIDYDFGPSLILPFLKHTAQGEGSFGVVSRIEIHADHIKPTPKVRQ